jgi:Immunoglobulin-like domain of bacterial spore germination
MERPGRRAARQIALLILIVAFGLAACGGEEQASTTEPATTSTGSTEPATTAETSAVTSGGGPGLDGQAAIVVVKPSPGATITSPVTISGTADVFEANVTVILLDADGNELARDFTTATCGTGCRGDYELELPFSVDAEQAGRIVVQDDDAAGTGSPPHVADVPVTLAP